MREALGKLLTEDSPALAYIDRARCQAAAAGETGDEVHRTDIELVLQLAHRALGLPDPPRPHRLNLG